jgi:2-polyprenyl-3-methyl-5-hydroxy-6-metoxy-1,4-benzoquinol methylase
MPVNVRTSMKVKNICNLCGGKNLTELIDFGSHPVCKHYLTNPLDKRPVWPVKLSFCESCGLTQLVDSCPPEVLYSNYVTLSSWKFQPHVQHQIDMIKQLDGITANAAIIEIGCNDGEFLHQLSKNGFNNIIGIEPAQDAYNIATAKGINTIQEFLTPALASNLVDERGQFDLFLSRQNLEHISDLRGVARSIEILVKQDGYVLIEVPNYSCNLRCQDYSLWEEHVNYFTIDTLRNFLALAGIKIIHDEIFLFSGEGIFILGRKTGNTNSSLGYLPELRAQNFYYVKFWPIFKKLINEYLATFKQDGKKIAVYGAGARVYCLINFTGIASYIDLIVDDQIEKQNTYMPGSKLPVVSSGALYDEKINICLLAVNTENEDKVLKRHTKWITSGGQFWSVSPPSDRLLPVWKKTLS